MRGEGSGTQEFVFPKGPGGKFSRVQISCFPAMVTLVLGRVPGGGGGILLRCTAILILPCPEGKQHFAVYSNVVGGAPSLGDGAPPWGPRGLFLQPSTQHHTASSLHSDTKSHGAEWMRVGPVSLCRCCFCPLAPPPPARNASHSRSPMPFGGHSPPPTWDLQRRACRDRRRTLSWCVVLQQDQDERRGGGGGHKQNRPHG